MMEVKAAYNGFPHSGTGQTQTSFASKWRLLQTINGAYFKLTHTQDLKVTPCFTCCIDLFIGHTFQLFKSFIYRWVITILLK